MPGESVEKRQQSPGESDSSLGLTEPRLIRAVGLGWHSKPEVLVALVLVGGQAGCLPLVVVDRSAVDNSGAQKGSSCSAQQRC